MRIGTTKRPFYRVVAVDERSKRTGAYIEILGTYNPLTEPKEIKLKQDRIDDWIKKGAQLSDGFLRIIGKAPQRLPRKPKKEKKEETPAQPAPEKTTEGEAPKEEVKNEETAKTEEKAAELAEPGETEATTTAESTPEVEATKPEPDAKVGEASDIPAAEEKDKDEGSS